MKMQKYLLTSANGEYLFTYASHKASIRKFEKENDCNLITVYKIGTTSSGLDVCETEFGTNFVVSPEFNEKGEITKEEIWECDIIANRCFYKGFTAGNSDFFTKTERTVLR